jgi:DNA-binding response OmpR family regulator
MPKMNGWEVCRELKSTPETTAIPVFFLTALGEEEDIIRYHKSEADGYFIKPFSMNILAKKLEEAVEKRRS